MTTPQPQAQAQPQPVLHSQSDDLQPHKLNAPASTGIIFADNPTFVICATALCDNCKLSHPELDVFPTTVSRGQGPREELWCFGCLKDYYLTVRGIELKRYFGQLYYK